MQTPNKTPCSGCGMCPYMSVECANSGECEKQKQEYPHQWVVEYSHQGVVSNTIPLEEVCCGEGECSKCPVEPSVSTSLQEGAEKFRKKLKKQIVGAIKSTLNAHGRIDKGLIGSVLKRLESQQEYRSLTEQWMKESDGSQRN